MKRLTFDFSVIPGTCLPGIALVFILQAGTTLAQQRILGVEDQDLPPEESSAQVEESDDSYRQRMELREGFPGQKTRIETTYSKPASNAKIDQLPVPSQKHIKDQMREMIMENGQWQPGQDLSGYPYDPSVAAQTDARLRRGEREAWSEELQKYEEREAQAYAQAMGQGENANPGAAMPGQPGQAQSGQPQPGQAGGQPGAQGGQAGQNGQGGMGGSPGSGSSGGPLAERNARALEAAAAYQGDSSSGQETESAPAGISENALSYLQSMNGGSAGAGQAGSQQHSGGQPNGQAVEAGSDQQTGEGSEGGQSAQMAQQGPSNQSGQSTQQGPGQAGSEGQSSSDALAGTIAVGDLQNMYAESGQAGGSGASSSAGGGASSSANSNASAGESASSSMGSSASFSTGSNASPSTNSSADSSTDSETRASASSAGKQEITYRDVQTEEEIEPGTLTLEELRGLDPRPPEGSGPE